jgi:hypothetical protein
MARKPLRILAPNGANLNREEKDECSKKKEKRAMRHTAPFYGKMLAPNGAKTIENEGA